MDDIQIYQSEDGALQLDVRLQQESVWLSQNQLCELFGRERTVITKHVNNVFKDEELDKNQVSAKFAHTAEDGKTYQVQHYNLDAIISVGYRVKSQQGVKFRQWATTTLKQHLLEGYTLNEKRLSENASQLQKTLELVSRAAAIPQNQAMGAGLVDIIAKYTNSFLWLQQYDEGLLTQPKGQAGGV